MRDGRRHLRAECDRCGRYLKFISQAEPYTTYADRNASETAIMDVLIMCYELEIELVADGGMVTFARAGDYRHAPRRLRELLL